MPYQFLDDLVPTDVAFRAAGKTGEEMFISAAEATMEVMVNDLGTITFQEQRNIELSDETLEMLLFQLLQELIYYKDADELLLRITELNIREDKEGYQLKALAQGEKINPAKHPLNTDVKAVTMHRFKVEQTQGGFEATVVLDL